MASRQWHLNAGVIVFALTLLVLFFIDIFRYEPSDLLWILTGLLMAVFGSIYPDLDHAWRKIFSHRDWFTHSAIFPVVLIILAVNGGDNSTLILFPILAFFCLGLATHMFLDYLPTWSHDKDNKFTLEDITYATGWVVDGLTGKELTQKMAGTYNIHFPKIVKRLGASRRTLPKKWTRMYLMANGTIMVILSIILFSVFNARSGSL